MQSVTNSSTDIVKGNMNKALFSVSKQFYPVLPLPLFKQRDRI